MPMNEYNITHICIRERDRQRQCEAVNLLEDNAWRQQKSNERQKEKEREIKGEYQEEEKKLLLLCASAVGGNETKDRE